MGSYRPRSFSNSRFFAHWILKQKKLINNHIKHLPVQSHVQRLWTVTCLLWLFLSFFCFNVQWKEKVTVWARSGSIASHNFSIIKLATELLIKTGNKMLPRVKKSSKD